MNHTCHANFCDKITHPKYFMCNKHWLQLPGKMKNKVWETYKATTEDTRTLSIPYMEACADAVEFIANLENVSIHNSYRRIANMRKEVKQ